MENTHVVVRSHFERLKDKKYGLRKWHCDDILEDKSLPDCVIKYLKVARYLGVEYDEIAPPLYATYKDKRVRIIMASRSGDVGITEMLGDVNGSGIRVYLPELTDFSDTP